MSYQFHVNVVIKKLFSDNNFWWVGFCSVIIFLTQKITFNIACIKFEVFLDKSSSFFHSRFLTCVSGWFSCNRCNF